MRKYLTLRSKFRPGPNGTGRPEVKAQVVQPEVVLERAERMKKERPGIQGGPPRWYFRAVKQQSHIPVWPKLMKG